MNNKTSKYKYGDQVRVREGINDPDFKVSIGEWSGVVDEIELLDNG